MSPVLYVPRRSAFLAKRWLQRHPECRAVTVLAAADLPAAAEKSFRSHSQVGQIIRLPEEPQSLDLKRQLFNGRSGIDSLPRLVWPLRLNSRPLHFVDAMSMAILAPLYPEIAALWQMGFRDFELFNLSGALSFRIPHMLEALADRHRGQRCFVVGNGPSLNRIDMAALEDEITLGSNRCFLGYEKWGFQFTYWGISDRLQIEEYYDEYENGISEETIKFFPFEYVPFWDLPGACPVNHLYGYPGFPEKPRFSDRSDVVYLGGSVTYMLMQIAAVMGCNPIILVGVDHRYDLPQLEAARRHVFRSRLKRALRPFGSLVSRVRPRRATDNGQVAPGNRRTDLWQTADARNPTHFDERYTAKRRFVPANLPVQNAAFDAARAWAEQTGIEILNATPGTALEAFPKVAFESLLERA